MSQRLLTGLASGLAAVVLITMASEMAEDCIEGTQRFSWLPAWIKPVFWLMLVLLASHEADKARATLLERRDK